MRDLFPTELVTKVKPNINSVEVHAQLSNNRHPVDGALVGAGLLSPSRVITKVYASKIVCKFTLECNVGCCDSRLVLRAIFWISMNGMDGGEGITVASSA